MVARGAQAHLQLIVLFVVSFFWFVFFFKLYYILTIESQRVQILFDFQSDDGSFLFT